MNIKRYGPVLVAAFLVVSPLFISGCAALLVGAGAAGGYHMAKEH